MTEGVMQGIVLGIVQGLGEFLPISSTAHLALVPYFTGWNDPGLSFDVALHLGTLIAVVSFFWRDWLDIGKSAWDGFFQKKQGTQDKKYASKLLWLLLLASVPGALAGYFLEEAAETVLRSPLVIAFSLGIVGLILYLVDRYAVHHKELKEIGLRDALLIGVSQAVAIIPGVSRSGATMTAALALGLSREAAARFSFLLSTPIIAGAAAFKLPDVLAGGVDAALFAGVGAAAVSGYLAIKLMLRFIARVGYAPFFWYRLFLAAAILIATFGA